MADYKALAQAIIDSVGGDAEPEDRISCLTKLMQAVSDAVGPETFASFYGRMEKARNVYVFGAGQSSIPARMLAGRLLEDSITARYVALGYETEVLHCMSDQDKVVSSLRRTMRSGISSRPQRPSRTHGVRISRSSPIR